MTLLIGVRSLQVNGRRPDVLEQSVRDISKQGIRKNYLNIYSCRLNYIGWKGIQEWKINSSVAITCIRIYLFEFFGFTQLYCNSSVRYSVKESEYVIKDSDSIQVDCVRLLPYLVLSSMCFQTFRVFKIYSNVL